MFVNFKVGVIENRVKFKIGRGPHVSRPEHFDPRPVPFGQSRLGPDHRAARPRPRPTVLAAPPPRAPPTAHPYPLHRLHPEAKRPFSSSLSPRVALPPSAAVDLSRASSHRSSRPRVPCFPSSRRAVPMSSLRPPSVHGLPRRPPLPPRAPHHRTPPPATDPPRRHLHEQPPLPPHLADPSTVAIDPSSVRPPTSSSAPTTPPWRSRPDEPSPSRCPPNRFPTPLARSSAPPRPTSPPACRKSAAAVAQMPGTSPLRCCRFGPAKCGPT
jgi:hypothetical protein